MANSNPVSALNEFCQKNKLNYIFEKTNEVGMSHCKTFTVRLLLSRIGDPSNAVEYYGSGQTIKSAKNDAASKAYGHNILQKLVDKQNKQDNVCAGPNYTYRPKSVSSTNSVNELSERLNSLQFLEDKQDKFYDTWLFAKKNKLSIAVDFDKIRRGIKHTHVFIKFKLGDEILIGKGSNDLEAINDAIKDVDFDTFSINQTKEYDESSSDDDGSHNVVRLHELDQQLNKNLEFTCLINGGQVNPIFLYKCQLGDLIAYGIGKNKKSAKNQSACRMLKKLNEDVEVESVVTTMTNRSRLDLKHIEEKVQEILKSTENAVSILELIDREREERTLKFTEESKQIGVQSYFTTECKMILGQDLKIKPEDMKTNTISKGGYTYLRTSSRSTKKKLSKMDAAEKMVNLLRGDGAYTNEEVKVNKELKLFKDENFVLKKDVINRDEVSKINYNILAKLANQSNNFLRDKPKYDSDYDFLSELQDMEFENRNHLTLDIRLSNEVYEKFNNANHDPIITCVINFRCGINLSALAKSLDEMEAKNEAAFIILQKLANVKDVFF